MSQSVYPDRRPSHGEEGGQTTGSAVLLPPLAAASVPPGQCAEGDWPPVGSLQRPGGREAAPHTLGQTRLTLRGGIKGSVSTLQECQK